MASLRYQVLDPLPPQLENHTGQFTAFLGSSLIVPVFLLSATIISESILPVFQRLVLPLKLFLGIFLGLLYHMLTFR